MAQHEEPKLSKPKTPSQLIFERLIDEGIRPHADSIAGIWERHGFPCLLFEVDQATWAKLGLPGALRDAGVVRLSARQLHALAETDDVTYHWLATPPCFEKLKLFVFAHKGTLLLNFIPGQGWSIEPGSTDAHVIN